MLLRLKAVAVHPAPLLGRPSGHAAPRLAAGTGASTTTARRRARNAVTVTMSLKEEPEGSRSGFAGGGGGGPSWDPGLEIHVPFEQRPVNEYSALKDGVLYSWAELSPGSFFLRLGSLWLITFTVLAAPIAAASFSPVSEATRRQQETLANFRG